MGESLFTGGAQAHQGITGAIVFLAEEGVLIGECLTPIGHRKVWL